MRGAEFFPEGGLERWTREADAALDHALARKLRQREALDGPVRAAIVLAARAHRSPVIVAMLGALAIANWDEARKLSGMPELAVGARPARASGRLPDLRAVLAVWASPKPTLGVGPIEPAVALDAGRMRAVEGRALRTPAGFVWQGAELPAKQTRARTDRPREVGRLDLWLDVERAITPYLAREAFPWLVEAVLGVWRPVARKERLGRIGADDEPGARQYALVRATPEEIASREQLARRMVRDHVRTLRAEIEGVLASDGLIPKRAPKGQRGKKLGLTRDGGDVTFKVSFFACHRRP